MVKINHKMEEKDSTRRGLILIFVL